MSGYIGSRAVRFLLISIGLATALVACTRTPVRFQNVGYNKGLEGSENKMLLLNAVRASKRYPMYFSASDALSGKYTIKGDLGTSFPFKVGPALGRELENTGFIAGGKRLPHRGAGSHVELQSFGIDPTLNVDSGFTNHSMANLMTAKFMNAILNDIGVDRFKFYLEQGWPEELILFMAIQEIGLSESNYDKIKDRPRKICRNNRFYRGKGVKYTPPEGFRAICENRDFLNAEAGAVHCDINHNHTITRSLTKNQLYEVKVEDEDNRTTEENIRLDEREAVINRLLSERYLVRVKNLDNAVDTSDKYQVRYNVFKNDPRDYCSFLKFSKFIRTLRLLKPRVNTVSVAGMFSTERRVTKYRQFRKLSRSDTPAPTLSNAEEITDIQTKESASRKMEVVIELPRDGVQSFTFGGSKNSATRVGYLSLRSPRDMLYYLGSLISAQLRSHHPHVPKILVGSQNAEVELFRIKTGLIGKIGGAVRVHHEGRTYAVPRPGDGEVLDHRSMQALTLIRQLITRGVERDELPKSSTVIVSGG